MQSIVNTRFSHYFTEKFPGDNSGETHPRPTPRVLYAKTPPTPVSSPQLLAWSEDLAKGFSLLSPEKNTDKNLDVLSGNLVLESMQPYSARYGGHQFGHWADQLGDGRAITLGEIKHTDNSYWELQLKGAGPTAYSRRADGRAVLRSSVREYLASEAMHFLGVPTTRALSLVQTGDPILRDMFYDGNAKHEPGAIVARMAPSFLRFGSFEILAAHEENELLKQLCDWTIETHFPELSDSPTKYNDWFNEVARRTAVLMTHWLRVGFVHGVMNTDNMSILGLSIDYGPYGWLEDYNPAWTPNTTDLPGRRYCFGRQAPIAAWNLQALASAIAPLVDDPESLASGLEMYKSTFETEFLKMMSAKLGLAPDNSDVLKLIEGLDKVLAASKADMTLFYRRLSNFDALSFQSSSNSNIEYFSGFNECFYQPLSEESSQLFAAWFKSYASALSGTKHENKKKTMDQTNPKYILRNWMLHKAIEAAEKEDLSVLNELEQLIQNPYDEQPSMEHWAQKRPEWATNKPGCSTLSCSS